MSNTLNDFTKLYLRALSENSYQTLIKDNFNYEITFREAKSMSSIYNQFISGIKFDDGSEIKLSTEDIVGFYLNNGHNNLENEDLAIIASILQTNDFEKIGKYIGNAKDKIAKLKAGTIKFASIIKNYVDRIDSYNPIDYTTVESNEVVKFKICMKNGREVTENDALLVFNEISCTKRYPCVVYSNSIKEVIVKCGNNMSVSFESDKIDKIKAPINSITVLNEVGNPIIFNFTSKSCLITINPKKINDDTVKKIKKFMHMIILEEEKTSKKVVGKITFNVERVIDNYSLYRFFITDPIASVLFYVDESARAWCSKDTFYVFFRDFSEEMLNGKVLKASDNYLRLSIPTDKNKSTSGFLIGFTSKNHDMLPSFLYKFSRLLSKLSNISSNTATIKPQKKGEKYKIYTRPIEALSIEAGKFFKHDSKSRSESAVVTSGYYYSKVCPASFQPIIINQEEIPEWKIYGREVMEFPPKEWGIEGSILVVCPRDEYPIINLKRNHQDDTGRIKALPCCSKEGNKNSIDEVVVGTSNRKGTTEQINKFGAIGTLNDSLANFLTVAYSDDGNHKFSKLGTDVDNNKFLKLNSFILAILVATGKSPFPGKELNFSSTENFQDNITAVKSLMVELPPEIYKQELYDMNDEQIISSILDPETFMDPYLYYRGLEIIFDIQIFTFTSDNGRKNPISRAEDNLQIATLEVPRCKYTHIRNDNKKDIVCIYKNYGSQDRKTQFPSCELIISAYGGGKNYNKKVNSSNFRFSKNLFTLLDKVCHPFEWERDDRVPIQYTCLDDPYSTINWNVHDFGQMGPIIGQEIDIYGKVYSFIFKEWVLIVPPTQPLFINNEIEGKHRIIKINNKDHKVLSGGVKTRPQLKSFAFAHSKFEASGEDYDGIWIPFNGKNKGLKILCKTRASRDLKNYGTENKINIINKTTILMTIINWLWKSDSINGKFPDFHLWWKSRSEIDDDIIFSQLPDTKINCHNIMLPNLSSYEERLDAMTDIWPFIFHRKKIHVSKKLYDRILNFFKVEEAYSRNMNPEDLYWAPNQFITGLIPTDDDFKRNGDIILTKPEHISDWISRNNNATFKYKSFHNTNVIVKTISQSYKKLLQPYPFEDSNGKIYLIQNSSKKTRPLNEAALQIAHYWRTHEKNPGYSYRRNDDKDFYGKIKYVEYRIGPNDIPIVYSEHDKSEGLTDYLQILCYDDGESYAAMLPLL
uniref:Uncharacterized protein n=1 Tax=viral metagenome TaxID=1070528 RepID=A0A6C0BBX8_9ZZZZ